MLKIDPRILDYAKWSLFASAAFSRPLCDLSQRLALLGTALLLYFGV